MYLEVPYREKDQAKALGARWDPLKKKWYIPEALLDQQDAFNRWLPQAQTSQASLLPEQETDQQAAQLSLSQLLVQVQHTLEAHFHTHLWVRAEIAELSERRHLYLHLVESDAQGRQLAAARAIIWQSQASSLLEKFKKATGSALSIGQKVLLKVQVRFHPQYEFSLNIEDIDPSYTLGDIEAQLKKIREILKASGLYDANRKLPQPEDFFHVAVIAPPKAAGLGDFQQDAQLLQKHKLCQFRYFHATFQGEEVESSFMAALDAVEAMHAQQPFDALVIIRGGGAKLDLHHLNKQILAERAARLPIPLFTGIGHERDNTILDEIAAQRFDTPSKVIAHIRDAIVQQAQQAAGSWYVIVQQSHGICQQAHHRLDHMRHSIMQGSRQVLFDHKTALQVASGQIHQLALQQSTRQRQRLTEVMAQLSERAYHPVRLQKQQLSRQFEQVRHDAHKQHVQAKERIQQWMRLILISGPQKQLSRGFVMVKTPQGKLVKSAQMAKQSKQLELTFQDGTINVEVTKHA